MKRLPWISILITIVWFLLYFGFLNELGPEEKRRVLLALGGKARSQVLDGGQTWRLLSSAFLHHSSFHLWSNVAGLFVLGVFLEKHVERVSLLCLTLVSTAIAMGDDVLIHDGVTVGGSVMVFSWAGAVLGHVFKEKKIKKHLPMIVSLGLYLSVAFWIGSKVVHIAHRTHLVALCLGFVLGMQLDTHSQRLTRGKLVLSFFALLAMVGLWLGQHNLVAHSKNTQRVAIGNAGLVLQIPAFWDVYQGDDSVTITNATDVLLWAGCVTEQKPPVLEQVIRQFLTDQLYLPQVFGVADDIKFRPARPFSTNEGRALSGYQVPFSFVGNQGHYEGLYHVWVFGLTRCSVVSTSWSHINGYAETLLQELLSSMAIESVLPSPNSEDYGSLFGCNSDGLQLGRKDGLPKVGDCSGANVRASKGCLLPYACQGSLRVSQEHQAGPRMG